MKYTHLGFSQQVAIDIGLDDRDLAILRWFVDFKDSGSMSKKIIDGELYYWVEYEKVVDEYPIFKFKKDTVYRRLKSMSKKGVLVHKTLKQGGVWSYYNLGKKYIELISDTKVDNEFGNKSEVVGNKSEGIGNKSEGNGYISESNGFKSRTKNPSTISIYHNPSTINNISTINSTCCTKEQLKEIVNQWNSLNLQRVMSINQGTNRYKMIHTRIKEYGFETVLQAIDNIRNSSFLRGQNKKNWIISFDWFIKPNNFIKVLEGNYKDKEVNVGATGGIGKGNKTGEVKFDFSRFSDDSGEWNGEDIETEY